MEKRYQQYWDSLREKKQSFWGMDSEITKKVPIIYTSEPISLIDSIPKEISIANEIVEEANYFIFNGKKKVRKIPFLSQLLPSRLMPKAENTSGHLFLTIDPEWMLRCSDQRYTSWQSCFAPDGCYHFSAKEYTTSINIAMAMITNSDMTKIIGRKFVIIPSRSYNNEREAIVFFAKHYGTFPIHYQRSLSAYIAESVFGSNKDNWKIISKADDCRDEEAKICVEDASNCGNSCFRSGNSKSIWFDNSLFVLREKSTDIDNAYIFFDSNEEEDDKDSDEYECAHCGDYWSINDLYNVYYDDDGACDLICESCLSSIAVMDDFTGGYIYLDDAVEFWHVDFRGDACYIRHTTKEGAFANLVEIYVIDGITLDNKLRKSELLYADKVPNSCMEYNGEYLCVDIGDTDDSAIMKLIEKLEGKNHEDKEEPKEVDTEALEEQRTTDN